jgi:hypothetical protein
MKPEGKRGHGHGLVTFRLWLRPEGLPSRDSADEAATVARGPKRLEADGEIRHFSSGYDCLTCTSLLHLLYLTLVNTHLQPRVLDAATVLSPIWDTSRHRHMEMASISW